jgi:Ni/Co efflux regulator RcnB
VVYWTQANNQGGIMDRSDKKYLAMSALTAALLAASASGLAQDRYHGDRNDNRYSQRNDDRDRDRDRDGYRGDDRRGDGRWEGRDNRRWDGAGPNHSFRRGDRLPPNYRNRQYVVNNWREHRLRPPPRGYQWVQTGGDYVLAAIATGIIADILINR